MTPREESFIPRDWIKRSEVGYRVFLNTKLDDVVCPNPETLSRYISLYQILRLVGPVSCPLTLPSSTSGLHDVSLVSQLRKCILDPYQPTEFKQFDLQPDLTFQPKPTRTVEPNAKMLGNKRIPIVIIVWAQFPDGDFIRELKSAMRRSYSYLFEVKF
jgi:hypothetical protein